jgi:hypothetical protein
MAQSSFWRTNGVQIKYSGDILSNKMLVSRDSTRKATAIWGTGCRKQQANTVVPGERPGRPTLGDGNRCFETQSNPFTTRQLCLSTSARKMAPRTGSGPQWAPQTTLAPLPRRDGRNLGAILGACDFLKRRREHTGDSGNFGVARVASNNGETALWDVLTHSGMFPCFLGGTLARFVRSARNAFTTATREAAGSITPSSSPRSAAKNGLATL